ncbi:class I adenylate-forming enzyme family protein [Streptomyces sp. CoH27]|uniref:class I adenylate-forming enzyme family protein n=1 Tax=Streptomyces sp. CoH27 TaxID=2875763 RepID=UPI001CD43CBC|nr:class I adenylate-forming enzyme family protein [Streptomyces sp. CoH27]
MTDGTDTGPALYPAFRAVALAVPGARALVGYDGTEATYADLLAGVDAAVGELAARLGPRDVLGLAVDDPFTFLSLYLAAARLGLVTVLLDSRLSAPERTHHAARFDVSWLALDRQPASGRGGFTLRETDDAEHHRARAATGYAPGDWVVHCTSGSTGEPKGIVMSQAAIAARVRLWGGELELTPADVVLCPLPLAHCHGIDVLTLPTLLAGASVVFARPGRLTGRGLARRIEDSAVTLMSGLPVLYQLLTDAQQVPPSWARSLRTVISGSAPLGPDLQERFHQRFGVPLRQVYGLSEIGVICFDKAHTGHGSIGTPIAGVEWRLAPAPDGTGGEDLHELHVRGPALARGYYRDPEASAEMFEDGWLRTRDLVRADPGGWYVRGRLSGFINVAGHKVGPLEIEAALRGCPGVLDSAVVGVPDPEQTERVAALLVTDDRFDLAEVRRLLAERLLSPQLPQRYAYVPAIPRTPLGKTDYTAVRRIMHAQEGSSQ